MRRRPSPTTRQPPGRARLAPRCFAAAVLTVLAAGATAQSDREMLVTCLDTFEGQTHVGRRFTREYGRHVLYCNFRVDILDGYDERRDAYERWRTQVYEQELARLAAAPPRTPATLPPPRLDPDALRFARCLTRHADRLALTEPDLDQDPARARLLAEEMTESCLRETGIR